MVCMLCTFLRGVLPTYSSSRVPGYMFSGMDLYGVHAVHVFAG